MGVLGIFHDITEAKRTEAALRESEERFRATFEQAAVGIAHVAPDGRFLRVNQRLCDIVGYFRVELLERAFHDITHPDDLDADLECVRQMLANEVSTYSIEKRYVRKDGSHVWANLTVALVRDAVGSPKYFISVIEDISKRKRAEEAETEARLLLRDVLDAVPVRVFWKDLEGRYLGCNLPFARDAGFGSPDDLIGKKDLELGWHGEADAYRADDRELMASGLPKIGYEEPQTAPNGYRIWLRTSKIPLKDTAGKIIGGRTQPRDTEKAVACSQVAREASGDFPWQGRVLVVDDEPIIRELVMEAAQTLGLVCDQAADAADAVAKTQQRAYDVVVLDLMLPDLSGLEAIPSIRRRGDTTRIIVITGHGDVESAAEALRARADDYLLKPFTISQLTASLERSLGRVKAAREMRQTYQQMNQRVARLEQQLERQSTGGVMALAKALEGRDPYTRGHSSRVATMALELARACGFHGEHLDQLAVGALLHDVGKIAVPDSILLKNGRLTAEEYERIKSHPRLGHDILLPLFGQGIVIECALHHHERWDGKGYPQGLAGESCPLPGRILAVCDAFDAMTSDRPYRPALSESEAMNEIEINRDKQFDPRLADLFCRMRPNLVLQQEQE